MTDAESFLWNQDSHRKRSVIWKKKAINPVSDANFGGYQAILRDPATGIYYGASESRKDGQAAGY